MNSLLNKAQQVLLNNHKAQGFTIPCEGLYPFQWFWDSGFIAIGYSHFDEAKAQSEISALLSGQWQNGFIPHIVFHNDSDTYFPGPDFHQSQLHPEANQSIPTSGITQPPVLGFVLKMIYENSKNKTSTLNFIKTVIDKVFLNHEYFYSRRDPLNEGLVYIYHNWESGTDNSPVWDDIWQSFNAPKHQYKRKDTSHVDASQRPTDREYDCYIHILEIAKGFNYDDKKIAEHSPFLVQDPLFNSILIKSNDSLVALYELIEGSEEKIAQLKTWQQKAKSSFNQKLFHKDLGTYVYYNLKSNQQIPLITAQSFLPLFAEIPDKERANVLLETLMTHFGSEDLYMCATFDTKHELFNPKKYWRGPIWMNLNWMIYHGLLNYSFDNAAKRIKTDTIELIERFGFHEYFDPRKHIAPQKGYGGNNFSWTAAMLIDFLKKD